MTIQQCRYVLEIARTGSFNEASKQLFVAQSTLSSCIKQLEQELGIQIFDRSNRGVFLTSEGAEFIRYAAQIVEQSRFITDRYQASEDIQQLHVATQHYDFITDIFCRLLSESDAEKCHFSLREIRTYDMIHEVETAASDIGIMVVRRGDRELMERFLHSKDLSFTPFLTTSPYVFVKKSHPLASKPLLKPDDLKSYPYVFYDQGANSATFFTEELIDEFQCDRRVEISDRASLMNLLLSSDCCTVGTGIMPSQLNGGKIVAIPLESSETYSIGYILNEDRKQNPLTEKFIQLLMEFGTTAR